MKKAIRKTGTEIKVNTLKISTGIWELFIAIISGLVIIAKAIISYSQKK